MLVRVRVADDRQNPLARMFPRQAQHPLNEPNRADAPGGDRGVGPLPEDRSDALALAEEAIDERLLTRRGLGLARARGEQAGRHFGVDRHERVALENADQRGVPLHADAVAEQCERHRIRNSHRLRRARRRAQSARRW